MENNILTEEDFINYYKESIRNLPEIGTKKYTHGLRKIYDYCIVEHKCQRPDDLCCSLVCRYIENYQAMYEKKHGVEMNASDIFKIRLPWWLHDKAYGL